MKQRSIKKSFVITSLCLSLVSTSQAALSLGDIAVIGFSSSSPDEFSFLVLNEIEAGEVFYFGDIDVNGNSVVQEDLWEVTTTSNIDEGVIINFTDSGTAWIDDLPALNITPINFGSSPYAGSTGGGASLSSSDSFIIFDSSDNAASVGNSTNLFYVSGNGGIPDGLSDSSGIVDRSGVTNFVYTGITTGTASELFLEISNDANWSTDPNLPTNNNVSSFVVLVPEPSTILTSALGLLSLLLRRSRS